MVLVPPAPASSPSRVLHSPTQSDEWFPDGSPKYKLRKSFGGEQSRCLQRSHSHDSGIVDARAASTDESRPRRRVRFADTNHDHHSSSRSARATSRVPKHTFNDRTRSMRIQKHMPSKYIAQAPPQKMASWDQRRKKELPEPREDPVLRSAKHKLERKDS